MEDYYFKIIKAFPINKEDSGYLLGADNIIGDEYFISFENNNDIVAKLTNRFYKTPLQFNHNDSRELYLIKNKGVNLRAYLSLVGFSEGNGNNNYWAEFFIIGFKKSKLKADTQFFSILSNKLAEGIKPDLNLSKVQIEKFYLDNSFFPSACMKFQKPEKGTVYLKKRKKLSENFIEMARKRNIGCYIFGWAFLLLFVALSILTIKSFIG